MLLVFFFVFFAVGNEGEKSYWVCEASSEQREWYRGIFREQKLWFTNITTPFFPLPPRRVGAQVTQIHAGTPPFPLTFPEHGAE